MKKYLKILLLIFIMASTISGQNFDGDFDGDISFGEISFQIKDFHIGGDYIDKDSNTEIDKVNGFLDIGLIKYGFSNIEVSGDASSYNERAKIKYTFSGPEFDMTNLKFNLFFKAPDIWNLMGFGQPSQSIENRLVKNDIIFSIGNIKQYFGASGSVDLSARNQIVEFRLDKIGFSVSNVNAGLIIDRNSKSTFNILDFKSEAKNIFFEFNTSDKVPSVENAAFQILLKNLEVNIPKEIEENPRFKEAADYLNIHSGRFRIRQIDLDLTYSNGKKSKLKGIIDTQFGKAIIDGSFFFQLVSGNSDIKFDHFKIDLSNLSRPINDYINMWESQTGKILQRKGTIISLNVLEWINEDDFRNINIDLPLPDILMLGEYRRSSYASEARTVMSNINNASKMYYQTRGEWPSTIDELERVGQLDVSRSTKLKWTFDLQLSDYGGKIIATSTEEMSGGAGHMVIYNADMGKFTGYGSPDGE
tara:strand:- start:171 stop:1595 length:1425 start_codon:yes stop_codon:yes gene_type:complete